MLYTTKMTEALQSFLVYNLYNVDTELSKLTLNGEEHMT